MEYGLITMDGTTGEPITTNGMTTNFESRIYMLTVVM